MRASLDKHPREVAGMFDQVARRYDLTNRVMTVGFDRRWRAAAVEALDLRPGERVLDLAGGTGVSSEPLRAAGASVVCCDFSLGMLRTGRARRPDLPFLAGDALRLPFAGGVFDAVTISFGLRNVAAVDGALAELLRVTRPGGRLVICEASHPQRPALRAVYRRWLLGALPIAGRLVSSDPAAYRYLADSIRAWPDQVALAESIKAAGWVGVGYRNLAFGSVALHRARRPA